ncbi:MAG: FTR1 family protein, partial [Leptolyngbyaceae bacterium]|nr:FTR1 family protein [Leptolyngbyaceae bacterium]
MLSVPTSRQFSRWIALTLSIILLIATPAWASNTPQTDLQPLDVNIENAIIQAEAQNLQEAASYYQAFREKWGEIEDGVKANSRTAYRAIEDAMGEVKVALSIQPESSSQLVAALKTLHATNQKFITGEFAQETSNSQTPIDTPSPRSNQVAIGSLMEYLKQAEAALETPALGTDQVATAASRIKQFQTDWVEVEGFVAAKSREAYSAIENNMAIAYGLVRSTPAQVAEAKKAIAQLQHDLQPFAEKTLQYNLFDSAVILLREGMEALLVLVALMAFLVKSGHESQGRWLWVGAGAGLIASVATALIIQLIFANIPVGSNRELLEGGTGLVAAALLFYVSYWLHSKSSMGAWQGYIKEKATAAMATNSVFSLALLSFLAVYREGAETVL